MFVSVENFSYLPDNTYNIYERFRLYAVNHEPILVSAFREIAYIAIAATLVSTFSGSIFGGLLITPCRATFGSYTFTRLTIPLFKKAFVYNTQKHLEKHKSTYIKMLISAQVLETIACAYFLGTAFVAASIFGVLLCFSFLEKFHGKKYHPPIIRPELAKIIME